MIHDAETIARSNIPAEIALTVEDVDRIRGNLRDARCRAIEAYCVEQDWPWVSKDLDRQERYVQLRISGQSHNMAEILATGKFPGTRTDVEWNRGHVNGSQFAENPVQAKIGDYYRRVAEEYGQNVTGKVYHAGLAKFSGDPRAWVSGRGEAEALIRERGWSSEGLVSVKAPMLDFPDDPPGVDPRLIASEVEAREASGEMLGCKSPLELTEKLADLRRPRTEAENLRLDEQKADKLVEGPL
jgi:hypothetical protein